MPGTEREVMGIDSLLLARNWRPVLHLGDAALEEALKAVQNPRVLHIATHGFFQADIERDRAGASLRSDASPPYQPLLRSGVLLAGAARTIEGKGASPADRGLDDGILTAYEAMNMNLDRTELVVLSACETGLGQIRNGEGVYGLQRSFQVAGARYVLMSLWKVDDRATQMLMQQLYLEWIARGDVREAFRAAEQRLRAVFSQPYYWGAFVMIGI